MQSKITSDDMSILMDCFIIATQQLEADRKLLCLHYGVKDKKILASMEKRKVDLEVTRRKFYDVYKEQFNDN